MAEYEQLKTNIRENINENGQGEITGNVLQNVLLNIVSNLGVGYQFMGIATPATDPGTPDQKVYYIASQSGTYTHFNGITIDRVSILKYDTQWNAIEIGIPSESSFNELYNIVNGRKIKQPTTRLLGYYLSPDASGKGEFTPSTGNGYFIVDVHLFGGEKITSNYGTQYAFFSEYEHGNPATYCAGTTRYSDYPQNVVIPQDAQYLYLYVANDTNLPVISVTGETESLADMVANAQNAIDKNKPYINKVEQLGWVTQFNGTSSVATLKKPLVLQNNGDNIEIDFKEISSPTLADGGYALTLGGSSFGIGISVSRTESLSYCYVRADDGTWLSTWSSAYVKLNKLKVAYENDVVHLYVNDVIVETHQEQLKLTIFAFGHGASQYGYWKGLINWIKVNGMLYDIFMNSNSTDVQLVNENGFLTQSQSDMLKSLTKEMYAQKDENGLIVFCKLPNGKFVGYPLIYRYRTFTAGQYPSFYDNWGIVKVALYEYTDIGMVQVDQLFEVGEAELAMRVPSGISEDTVYVGGYAHGFENILTNDNDERLICFLIDNQKIGESENFALKPVGRVDVIQETELCQAYTNSNPFARVRKNWVFENGKLSITTKVTISRVVPIQWMQMGMFCVFRRQAGDTSKQYLTNRAIKNNLPFVVWEIEDGWNIPSLMNEDNDCTKITEYGQVGLGFSMEIANANTRSNGGMFIHNNGAGLYNKIYYSHGYDFTPNIGDEMHATQIWSIEG